MQGDNQTKGITVASVQTAEVAFTGDTGAELLEQTAPDHDLFNARLLIIECTFLDDAVDQAGARSRGHLHVRDIAQHADKFKVCPKLFSYTCTWLLTAD